MWQSRSSSLMIPLMSYLKQYKSGWFFFKWNESQILTSVLKFLDHISIDWFVYEIRHWSDIGFLIGNPTFLSSLQCFHSLWCCLFHQNCMPWKVIAWVILLLFNTVFEFLSTFVSGKQWHHEYQGQLPRHLCRKTMREIAWSVACWWIHSLFDFAFETEI